MFTEESKVITRFAPSPTGFMHVGNARIALLCWAYAKKNNGKFILRIDDTDLERCKDEYEESIYEDLKWLGIQWDFVEKQTMHQQIFLEAIKNLKEKKILYPCYETKEELEIRRKLQTKSGMPPMYDRHSLHLTNDQIKQYEQQGRKPHWRFKMDHSKPIIWQDLIRGEIEFNPEKISDPIVIRSDESYTYLLISVISDIYHKITDIIRGEDHITNTASQIQMFEALGHIPPRMGHMSLLKIEEGKISKRNNENEYSIRNLRELGIDPLAIKIYLLSIGYSHNNNIYDTIENIIKGFEISHYSSSVAKISLEDIQRINTKIIHQTTYESLINGIGSIYKDQLIEAEWNAIRTNISNYNEINDWINIIKEGFQNIEIDAKHKDVLKIAIELLPTAWQNQELISQDGAQEWINDIGKNSGKKGKDLFMPIRLALTNKEHGPEIFKITKILGREKILQRLKAACGYNL